MRRSRRIHRLIGAGALAALGAVTLVLALAWWQAGRAPAWWERASALPADPERTAEALENGVSAAIYSHRAAGEPWTVEVSAQDLNAWLTKRLPRWLANRGANWPRGYGTPRLWVDRAWIGVGVASGDSDEEQRAGGRVFSIEASPTLGVTGGLRLDDLRAAVGRLGLPSGRAASAMVSLAPRAGGEKSGLGGLADLLAAGGGVVLADTVVELEDRRRVRLKSIELSEGRIRLTCVHEAPAEAPAHQ